MTPNQKFKSFREKLSLTQSELADILDVSQGTITDIERGRIGVSKRVQKKITEKYNIESGYFSREKLQENTTLNQGNESGYNQDKAKNVAYVDSLKGEKKALYFTYKLLEKLSLKGVKSADIQSIVLSEAEKLEDKTLYYFLLSSNEIATTRQDLQEVKHTITEMGMDLVEVIKIFKPNFEDVLDSDIQFSDYNDFKKKRFDNLERLVKYQPALNDLHSALMKFISEYGILSGKKIEKKK